MPDLLQAPSPLTWVARLALLRSYVTPARVGVGLAGAALVVAFALMFLRAPSPQPELLLPKAGEPAATEVPGLDASGVDLDVDSTGGEAGAAASVGGVPGASLEGSLGPGGASVVTAHAAGQVVVPGVYSVPEGARIADLITAAGGLLPKADVDRLNLAARVVDGTRVYVAAKGEEIPPSGEAGLTPGLVSGPGSGVAGGRRAPAAPVDLNTADAVLLDTLPGVGPATAASILTYRERDGRFDSVTELLEVPGIGPAKLEAIRPLVVAS